MKLADLEAQARRWAEEAAHEATYAAAMRDARRATIVALMKDQIVDGLVAMYDLDRDELAAYLTLSEDGQIWRGDDNLVRVIAHLDIPRHERIRSLGYTNESTPPEWQVGDGRYGDLPTALLAASNMYDRSIPRRSPDDPA